MKRLFITLGLYFFYPLSFAATALGAAGPNQTLLPALFPIYVKDTTVSRFPAPGFVKKMLPTDNEYKENPGCYLVCYSHEENHSVYPVSADIFVHGQVRIPGRYVDGQCIPDRYQGDDVSEEPDFKKLCNDKILSCNHTCWAGTQSGGWFTNN